MAKKTKHASIEVIDFHFPEEEVRGYILPSLSFLRFVLPGALLMGIIAMGSAGVFYFKKHSELESYRTHLQQERIATEQKLKARNKISAQIDFVELMGRWMEISLPSQRFIVELTEEIPPESRIANLEMRLAAGYPQMELKMQVESFDGRDSYEEVLRVSNYLTTKGFVNNGETMPAMGTRSHELTGSYLLPQMSEMEVFE